MLTRHRCMFLVLALLIVSTVPTAAQNWSRAFGPMGLDGPGVYDGEGYCMGVWGGQLYVGGWFEEAGGVASPYVAAWDGTDWNDVGDGVSNIPSFILPVMTGVIVGGNFLQAGGEDVVGCARWDGIFWHRMHGLPVGPDAGAVHNGVIYVGGNFGTGDIFTPRVPVMRWNGIDWTYPTNAGTWAIEAECHALVHFNTRLHIGGRFPSFSSPDTSWNHRAWREEDGMEMYGRGLTYGDVDCMTVEDAGLWLGGSFQFADGQESRGLVYQAWGGTYFPVNAASTPRHLHGLVVRGGILYTAGREWESDEQWVVRTYNGGQWGSPLGGPFTDGINTIGTGPDGDLYALGFFKNGIVRWDYDEWVHLGGGIGVANHTSHWFKALVEYDGDIIAAGDNVSLPTVLEEELNCEGVVRWDGDAWHRMSNGIPDDITSLAVYQGNLYAGLAWRVYDHRVYMWNDEEWVGVGDASSRVMSLIVHDDDLIAGGSFTFIGGVTVAGVGAYNGGAWRAVGSLPGSSVSALFSNNGVLYAGGRFVVDGGPLLPGVMRWTGSEWELLGHQFDDGVLNALTEWQGAIVAGGSFTTGGGTTYNGLARWDGSAWQQMGSGIGGDYLYGVSSLRGTETHLFVGGDFTTMDGATARGIAQWDGDVWSEVGEGVTEGGALRPSVSALLVSDGDLFLGGSFGMAGSTPSCCMAQWHVGSLVSIQVSDLEAVPHPDGIPCVDISWRAAVDADSGEFRLHGLARGESWLVDRRAAVGQVYRVRDGAPQLAGVDRVDYTLEYRANGGRWQAVGTASTALELTGPPVSVAVSPNPFNPTTTVVFVLPRAGDVRLVAYDLTGKQVAVLVDEHRSVGRYRIAWRGVDDDGHELASGTYILRLTAAGSVRTTKAVIVR